jgi:carboxylesterase
MSIIKKTNDLYHKLWPELADRLREALRQGPNARLSLARELASFEYYHPECERSGARMDQRSFIFEHDRITAQSFLLIHGFTACPYEMRELGEALFGRDGNVYGARLAGHGTQVADFALYNRKDWLDSARRGLAITLLLGEEVTIIGESMGGALTVLLAAEFAEFIGRLVLCAPCFRVANHKAFLARFALFRHFMPYSDMGENQEWQGDYWYPRIPTRLIAELLRLAAKARRMGPRIQTPTLIIQANDDSAVNPGAAARFFQSMHRLSLEQKHLICFDNGHHNLTIGINPRKDEVYKWIEEFCGI